MIPRDPWARVPEDERVRLVVVVGCSRAKRDRPADAGELYTGSFHKLCMETARSLRPDRLFVLSARYGLVGPGHPMRPYDTRIGDPDQVKPARLVRQAKMMGCWQSDLTIVLAGREYVELARKVWPDAVAPLEGARGIAAMRRILAEIRDRK
ncbi:hypothetical protein E1264_03460 [Actinomadura sp. KC216]|uniref:DUF6884 domain-containing protein n=1 Tax=Actinomadura sp. KC216 TaxID=2530370 RepID=UPI00104A1E7E|nr:DUF6884 domain-containing protein [Actinomadura sp. KC216]TDB90897.1 hypothetical protein E1264_03460 [Actinomadura sp. KC216]